MLISTQMSSGIQRITACYLLSGRACSSRGEFYPVPPRRCEFLTDTAIAAISSPSSRSRSLAFCRLNPSCHGRT
jgi:hypothetical protein